MLNVLLVLRITYSWMNSFDFYVLRVPTRALAGIGLDCLRTALPKAEPDAGQSVQI